MRTPHVSETDDKARLGSVSSTALPATEPSRPEKLTTAQSRPLRDSDSCARRQRSPSMPSCSSCTASQLNIAIGTRPQSQYDGLHRIRTQTPQLTSTRLTSTRQQLRLRNNLHMPLLRLRARSLAAARDAALTPTSTIDTRSGYSKPSHLTAMTPSDLIDARFPALVWQK